MYRMRAEAELVVMLVVTELVTTVVHVVFHAIHFKEAILQDCPQHKSDVTPARTSVRKPYRRSYRL